MHAPRQAHAVTVHLLIAAVCVFLFCLFCFFGEVSFSEYFCTNTVFYACGHLRIFPSLPGFSPTIFDRDASSALLHLVRQLPGIILIALEM